MANLKKDSIETRQVAILCANGVDSNSLNAMMKALTAQGAQCKTIAPKLGDIILSDGKKIKADQSFLIATSVVFDAVYIPGGPESIAALTAEADALHFVEEAYKHCKPVAADEDAREFLQYTHVGNKLEEAGYDANADGVIIGTNVAKAFINAMKEHRFWEREKAGKIPA